PTTRRRVACLACRLLRSMASCSGDWTACPCCVLIWPAMPGLTGRTGVPCVRFHRAWHPRFEHFPHAGKGGAGFTLSCQSTVSLAQACVGFASEGGQCDLQEWQQPAVARSAITKQETRHGNPASRPPADVGRRAEGYLRFV